MIGVSKTSIYRKKKRSGQLTKLEGPRERKRGGSQKGKKTLIAKSEPKCRTK